MWIKYGQYIWTYNFWDTWLGLRILSNSLLCISDISYKPKSLCGWLTWQESLFVWSQREVLKDEDFSFLSSSTKFRKKWGVSLNISLIVVVLLYSWAVNVDIRLMIAEEYLEPSQIATMGLLAKIINGQKLLTISVKKLHRRCLKDFSKILLSFCKCLKCINQGCWVSWTMVTWLRHYKLFCFKIFTQVGVMSDERHELSTKWRTSGKLL